MANTATIKRKGFGQVEPNQVIGIITAEFIDAIPAADSVGDILEQGQFLRLNKTGDKLVKPGDAEAIGPCVMVYNEEHFYDERDGYHKDYAMKKEDFIDNTLVPRCIRPVELDLLTTNSFLAANTSKNAILADAITLTEGNEVGVNNDGFFCAKADAYEGSPVWVVVKCYTMPDEQEAVKLRCISR